MDRPGGVMDRPGGVMDRPGAGATRRLNRRALVVIGATATGLALPATGIIDHVLLDAHPAAGFNAGSVTHWVCALLFIGLVTWHVALNRKAYRRHIAEVSGCLVFSRETGGATTARSDRARPARGGPGSRERLRERASVRLDRRACTACGACVRACAHRVIDLVDLPFHHHARIRRPDACRGCLACVTACEHGAILVDPQAHAARSRAAFSQRAPRP